VALAGNARTVDYGHLQSKTIAAIVAQETSATLIRRSLLIIIRPTINAAAGIAGNK